MAGDGAGTEQAGKGGGGRDGCGCRNRVQLPLVCLGQTRGGNGGRRREGCGYWSRGRVLELVEAVEGEETDVFSNYVGCSAVC